MEKAENLQRNMKSHPLPAILMHPQVFSGFDSKRTVEISDAIWGKNEANT